MNVIYKNESGVPNRTTPTSTTLTANAVVGSRFYFTFQPDDVGITEVTNVVETSSATGIIDIYGETILALHRNSTAGVMYDSVSPSEAAVLQPGDKLRMEINASVTTATSREMYLNAILLPIY